MVDRLNGILIGGMLSSSPSSLITGVLNLGWFTVTVVEHPSRGGPSRPDSRPVEDEKYFLQFNLVFNSRVHKKSIELSKKKAGLIVNVSNLVKKPNSILVKVKNFIKAS